VSPSRRFVVVALVVILALVGLPTAKAMVADVPVEAGTDAGGGAPVELVVPGAGLVAEPAALLGAGPQA
jgi:hypothetical protein